MATHWTLGCDAKDPQMLADFWAAALGYVSEPGYDDPDGASIVDPEGKGPAIGWMRVPEAKAAKNRVHIDIRVAGEGPWDMTARERLIRAKVPELVALGATVVRAPPTSASRGTEPSMALTWRPATLDDVPALTRLINTAIEADGTGRPIPEQAIARTTTARPSDTSSCWSLKGTSSAWPDGPRTRARLCRASSRPRSPGRPADGP